VSDPDSTCWTIVRDAARGVATARAEFARRYEPIIRAYLGARWRDRPWQKEVDDAVQDVFVDCLKPGGPLERADRTRSGGFRGFLYGVVRNVALRVEETSARRHALEGRWLEPAHADRAGPTGDDFAAAFDRAWAEAVMRDAAALQRERARLRGAAAVARVELLEQRFVNGLPVREIARRRGEDAARVHHQYAQARDEVRVALEDVLRAHHGAVASELDGEVQRLLDALVG
jgi:RNA polymerase sigma-70 factor (ECF subfamily)